MSTAALSRVASEIQVLEFRRDQNDYFLSVDPNEIAALDSGLIPGWTRTGEAFLAYASDSAIESNMSPVCRFFGRSDAGQHSHFFSAYADECAAVSAWLSDQWLLESSNVFIVALPDQPTAHARREPCRSIVSTTTTAARSIIATRPRARSRRR